MKRRADIPVDLFGERPPQGADVNGCGPSGLGWLVPDFWGTWREAGDRHDWAYHTYALWRQPGLRGLIQLILLRRVADIALGLNCYVCVINRWPTWAAILIGSWLPLVYMLAVMLFGWIVFYGCKIAAWWENQ